MRWRLFKNHELVTPLEYSGASWIEPGELEKYREFDEICGIRQVNEFMELVLKSAGDNAALEADLPDIMSALRAARDSCIEDGESSVQQCREFVASVAALARFLGFRSALDERVSWGKDALKVAERLGDDLAIAELCSSTIAWPLLQLGKNDEAKSYSLRGLKAARQCKDQEAAGRWAGNAARTLSGIARDSKDGDSALEWAEQAAAYARICGDPVLAKGAELDFGYAALLRGNFTEAEDRFRSLLSSEESGEDNERIGYRCIDVALAVMNRAIRSGVEIEKLRLCQEARLLLERALGLATQINHEIMIGEAKIGLAVIARALGDEDNYSRLLADGRRRFAELGIRRGGRWEQFVLNPGNGGH
jgi:tetratricopeptide (TPR) repeat protein